MPIPLNIEVYERGASGVPSSIYATNLIGQISSYQHTISDRFGFESMQVSLPCTLETANDWLQNGLMRSVIVSGPDAETVWEGYLETITATIGQKSASVSLRNMSNRVRVLFTAGGTPQSSSILNDTASQALYGIKDGVKTMEHTNQTTANNAAAVMLASYSLSRSRQPTEAKTGALGDIALELTFAGWYQTIEWVFASLNDSTFLDTGTQVQNVLTAINTVNSFLSSDFSNIPTTGVTTEKYIAPNTTYRAKLDALLDVGNSSNNQLTWGVYEDRVFKTAPWAGAAPNTITYRENARTGVIYDAYGNVVAPWDVRPNAMSQVVQLLDVGPTSGAVDAAARKYVGRVTCSIQSDQIGCTLEPSNVDTFDAALLAVRIY